MGVEAAFVSAILARTMITASDHSKLARTRFSPPGWKIRRYVSSTNQCGVTVATITATTVAEEPCL